jgi:hypothetical protein
VASKKAQTTDATPMGQTPDDDLAAILEAIAAAAASPQGQSSTGYQSSYYGVPVGYKRKDKVKAGIFKLDGTLSREGYYDLNNDPYDILYNRMNDVLRNDLRDTLFAKGYYDTKDKPSPNRITKDDEAAVSKLLLEANWTQTDYNDLLSQIKGRPDEQPTGGAVKRYTLTSAEDLKVIANRVAIETLGRRLDDSDAEAFAKLYQRKQLKYQQQDQSKMSGAVVQPADPQTMVMNQLKEKYAGETEAYGYIQAVDRLAKLVGAY